MFLIELPIDGVMDAHTTALLGTAATAAMPTQALQDRQLGSVIDGRYELLSVLGEGGHGIVYRARQRSTDQTVAIKLLRPQAMNASDLAIAVARFDREMRLIARLSHPNIVRLIDSGGLDDQSIYTVLELIEGESLAELLDREGSLAPREAKRLMGQVLDALSCAHQLGIVHRDLKPENIMITTTGARRNAMVLDFGIAALVEEARAADYRSLTAQGQINGTPHYMAPEQLLGEHPTPQTDLYAWGLIFAETLTGQTLVDGATLISIISQQISGDPVPVPADLLQGPLGPVIAKAVKKSLPQRYLTATQALRSLEACLLDDETAPMLALSRGLHGPSRPSGAFAQRPGLARSGAAPSSSSLLKLVAESCVFWLHENDTPLTASLRGVKFRVSRWLGRALPAAVGRLSPFEKVGIVASTLLSALVVLTGAVVWVARASEPQHHVPVVAAATLAAADRTDRPSPDDGAEAEPSLSPQAIEIAPDPVAEAPETEPRPRRTAAPVQVAGTQGAKMVWVDAQLFQMGLNDDDIHALASLCEDSPSPSCSPELWESARPAHIRDPAPFYLDTHEVTNAEYQECVDSKKCPAINLRRCELIGEAGSFSIRRLTRKRRSALALRVTASDLPAACVSRVEAATFCHWANKRLPTEAEWEYAASGGGTRLFPWGKLEQDGLSRANGADQALAVVMEWEGRLLASVAPHRDAYAFAAPTGSFDTGRAAAGPFDLSGNVAEWVSDPYQPYLSEPNRRVSVRSGIVRGGSWADFGPGLSTKARRPMAPSSRSANVGFRCAADGV